MRKMIARALQNTMEAERNARQLEFVIAQVNTMLKGLKAMGAESMDDSILKQIKELEDQIAYMTSVLHDVRQGKKTLV